MEIDELKEPLKEFDDIRLECIRQVKFYVNLASDKLGVRIPMPRVLFSIKGTTAGRAYYNENRITFNPILLRDNVERFLERTPGHEVAHLVAHAKYPQQIIKPHGSEWGRVMWAFGLPAIRCHNYDVSSVYPGRNKYVSPRRYRVEGGVARGISVGRVIELD